MINLAIEYFLAFESKNLYKLETMFADTISLTDWDINLHGKTEVLAATENIFKTVNRLKITIERLLSNNNTVIAELKILIDDNILLNVVDILDFDTGGKLQKITAYKR